MMQSNLFILIPEAIRTALMRTLFFFFFCTSSNPRGLNSIYIYLHGSIIRQVYKVLAYIEVIYIYTHIKKNQGLGKSPVLYNSILYISAQSAVRCVAICVRLNAIMQKA